MTPEQFKRTLERLCLTQIQAARILEVTDRTLRRYATGDCNVPPPTAKLLKLAVAGKISTRDIGDA